MKEYNCIYKCVNSLGTVDNSNVLRNLKSNKLCSVNTFMKVIPLSER